MQAVSIVCAFVFSFLFLTPKPILAEDPECVCTIRSFTNPDPIVISDNCPSEDFTPVCHVSGSSLYDLSVTCDCIESNSGGCTKEGGVPTSSKPCCTGTFEFNYGSGLMCIKNGTDPYHNCVSKGKPGPGQTCCAGSSLNDEGICVDLKNKLDITCGTSGQGIKTAIGCFPVFGSTNDFLGALLKWAVGIGSGIAFALMLYAGFMIMTASGNPERMKAGQELLTSAIAGLILLIFSIFILNFIGVDILGLDQFGFNK